MEKILILDRVWAKLKKLNQSELFGIQNKDLKIVSSLESKNGLENLGLFIRDFHQCKELPEFRDKVILSVNDNKPDCRYFDRNDKERCIEHQIINYATDFNERNHGIIDENVLQKATVAVIGLGSGGASTAVYLLRCGVTRLMLIDPDTVSLGNLCRSEYDLYDLGMKKTEALLRKLMRINPCADIQIYDEDVLSMDDAVLRSIIETADLIIEATDSVKTKLVINGLAYNCTPVIYPSVYDMGRGSDILFTVPNATPCFECVFHNIVDQMKELKKGEWDYSTGTSKPMGGLIADIQVVVARSVKIALALLTVDQQNSFLEKITEPGCSYLLIGNEKDFFIFDKPFQEVWAETEFNKDCTCQTLR